MLFEWLHGDSAPAKIWLNRNKSVNWNDSYKVKGQWWYTYDPEEDNGFFFIEFAAGWGYRKRHAFLQTNGDEAILIPRDHEIYKASFWSTDSICHNNTVTVTIRRMQHEPNALVPPL